MRKVTGAEGWGDRPVRRRSRFTLACARAEPLALGAQSWTDGVAAKGDVVEAPLRIRTDGMLALRGVYRHARPTSAHSSAPPSQATRRVEWLLSRRARRAAHLNNLTA